MHTARAAFAALAGVALIAWWSAEVLGALGAELASRRPTLSHAMAELLLGGALLLGVWLERRSPEKGRLVLAGAFGVLVYASVSVVSDYGGEPVMQTVLGVTAVLAVIALGSIVGEER